MPAEEFNPLLGIVREEECYSRARTTVRPLDNFIVNNQCNFTNNNSTGKWNFELSIIFIKIMNDFTEYKIVF